MRSWSRAICLAVCAWTATAAPMHAAFHFWDIKEVFSNASGTVQFIEFVCGAFPGEHFLAGHNLTATSDGVPVSFTFPGNLPTQQSTSNRHFLMATAGFASLAGGVAPDFTLPANFFNPNAASITLNFAFGTDSITFAGSLLPKDGVNSLTDQTPAGAQNLVAGVNSPTNFAGAAGSINVGGPPLKAADFDGSGSVTGADLNNNWRPGYGMQGAGVGRNDGDADGDLDVDGVDFLRWQVDLDAAAIAAGGAAPEPGTNLLAAVGAGGAATLRRRAALKRKVP